MKIHDIKGRVSGSKKRLGRGTGSGHGKTAGRGTKGQKSRTGHSKLPATFEGGQMPLHMRLPKRKGFTRSVAKPVTITLGALAKLPDGSTINLETLKSNGLLPRSAGQAKLVAGGQLDRKFKVEIATTRAAGVVIREAGGEIVTSER